jgi:hypothetical protein
MTNMSATIVENETATMVFSSGTKGATRRDLATQILHADEEAYAKQLEPFGGKEDMWKGGDVYVFILLLFMS